MTKFPSDAPKRRVVKALEILGFRIVRQKEHISMERESPEGGKTPLTNQISLK
jgi:predicted RNA binding protein YcfA (HicA-like mRNA interferase family)